MGEEGESLTELMGYHSEWNLGSPGGWDYQRITQEIGKKVWEKINRFNKIPVSLDFDHPLLYPITGFTDMLLEAGRKRDRGPSLVIAVVAEEETLEEVAENINLARRLDGIDGVKGFLVAPNEIELVSGRVCVKGEPLSILFMDFNTDTLLTLHRRHNLTPLLMAVREGRVINPRGTEPINVKSTFELITGPMKDRFHPETVRRTPWTRQFNQRKTEGPRGEKIDDLIEWTRTNWVDLVLKPERGYSGIGVRVGGVNEDAQEAISKALKEGGYIVQEKIPLNDWAEDNPFLDNEKETVGLTRYQTDFRCLMGKDGLFGFLGRFGGVPTNVGSGGGVQPLAILRSPMTVREAVERVNESILEIGYADMADVAETQRELALEENFTYLLGPIKIALRPRIIAPGHMGALKKYCRSVWLDCLLLEKMWIEGELDGFIHIEEEELEIARSQPWSGSHAVFATDGLFSFGAHPLSK